MKTTIQAGRPMTTSWCVALSLVLLLSHTAAVSAGARDQAKRMHDRIAGVPPTGATLDEMESDINSGNALTAAFTAMEANEFYDVTLKNLVAPWTNEAMSSFVPLNDYTATVVGLVRDDKDFRTVLYGDILYLGAPSLGLPNYAVSNNNHYQELEAKGFSLKDNLVEVPQSNYNNVPAGATAGVMTSRAASQAFFSAGTNRAMFRFTLLNHLCMDLEQVADTTRPPDRIRQDISRSPGGDSRVFLNNCVGCHSGMDPMAQAFAYYDYEYDANSDPDGNLGRLIYDSTRVHSKYHINSNNFEYGYITPDDSWDNYWRSGPNRRLGWEGGMTGSGSGAKSLGRELAHSDAFAACQVKKVFKNVCLRDAVDGNDRSQIQAMVSSFRSNNFNLKQVFAESAVYCMGD